MFYLEMLEKLSHFVFCNQRELEFDLVVVVDVEDEIFFA
jgi:hypothetical protein